MPVCPKRADALHWHSQCLLLPEVSDTMRTQSRRTGSPFGSGQRPLSPQQPSFHGSVGSAEGKKTFVEMQPEVSSEGGGLGVFNATHAQINSCEGGRLGVFNAPQLFQASDAMHAQISRLPTPFGSDRRSSSPCRHSDRVISFPESTKNTASCSGVAQTATISRPSKAGFSWAGGPSACSSMEDTCYEVIRARQKLISSTSTLDRMPLTNKSLVSECSTHVPCSTPGENGTFTSFVQSGCTSLNGSRQSLNGNKCSHQRSTSTGASPNVSFEAGRRGRERRRGRPKSPRPSGGLRPHEIRENWEKSLCDKKWSEKGGIKVQSIAERSSSVPVTGNQKRVIMRAVPKADVEQHFLGSLRPEN